MRFEESDRRKQCVHASAIKMTQRSTREPHELDRITISNYYSLLYTKLQSNKDEHMTRRTGTLNIEK